MNNPQALPGTDGSERAEYLPEEWFELESEFLAKYRTYCSDEGFRNVFDTKDEANAEDNEGDEEDSGGEDFDERFYYDNSMGLSKSVIYDPPLFDRTDLFHPLHDRDFRISHASRVVLGSYKSIAMMPGLMRALGNQVDPLASEILSRIQDNRKRHPGVRNALKSAVTLEARLAGIQKDSAPKRVVTVSGNTPLAVLHDRVLCPVFGWTRGYHDYRFAIPPAGYSPYEPPKFAILEILFGPEFRRPSLIGRHGFYGTLRSIDVLASIPDAKVCVADLLYSKGKELWHVLGGSSSGWKTVLTVDTITPSNTESAKGSRLPMVLSGEGPNVPETIVLSFGSEYDDYDCGGPQAFTLGCEMLRLSNESSENAWLKDWLLQEVGSSVQEADFALTEQFDIQAATRALRQAQRGDRSYNPENSRMWMHHLFGNASSVFPPGTEMSKSGNLMVPGGACNTCYKTGEQLQSNLKKCGQCKNVNYCSRECQLKDWKTHRKICVPKSK
ncbi:expressed unknown protein [Seminavis robusta]|uniref:MYND-type domain-containing protein n=1 Tax=Seminavis robusta TaxID=568900 RepID=A0A9N8EIZ3_9STRA|nr:expressed unknown protein [Seminavis robusta]|eukprot:Sro1031_g233490.1 n/a (499) ;mRNA; f:33184-34680